MKALIAGNKIVQLVDKEFPVHSNFYWEEAEADTEVGDTHTEGAGFVKKPADPTPTDIEQWAPHFPKYFLRMHYPR